MPKLVKNGTMLIRESARFPVSLQLAGSVYCKDWRSLHETDCHALDQMLRSKGCTMFALGRGFHSFALGHGDQAVKLGVLRVGRRIGRAYFNCMQVSQIVERRWLGIPYVRVEGHAFHIQIGSIQSLAAPASPEP